MKLLRIIKSPKSGKKWRAIFETDTGREKHTDFGDSTMEDYTQHGDEERRENYRSRHRKDLDTDDPTRAGFLSWYVLWGDSKSFSKNLESYKKRFNL